MIQLCGVDRTFVVGGRPVHALQNVNLKIESGDYVSIMGASGSGKSTLLKTVTRECYPRFPLESRVRIWGEEIWTLFELRATLGIVTNDLVALCTKPYSAPFVSRAPIIATVLLMATSYTPRSCYGYSARPPWSRPSASISTSSKSRELLLSSP